MAKKKLFYFYLFISCIKSSIGKTVLKCTPEFCDEYVQKFPCPPLDPRCSNPKISIVFPSPTVCNCCETCFLFQEIGEDCVVGRPGQPLPKVICKPGTECVNGKCQKMKKEDPDFYKGYECEKEQCTCAVLENQKPKKIFGKFKKTEIKKTESQCLCSISAYSAKNLINYFLPFPNLFLPIPRCLPNGQFDPLQCVNDMCGCVNKVTGTWDMSVRKVSIGALGPNNPKCFDPKRHTPGDYHTQCEKARKVFMSDKFWADTENFKIMFSGKIQCTPDGEYDLNAPQD